MPPPVPRLTFKCETCGATFERMACQLTRADHPPRYCSVPCRAAGKRSGKTVSCQKCGTLFHRKASDLGTGGFCSRTCYEASRVAQRTSYPKIGARHAHRIVAEQKLGRPLMPGEIVHHANGDRQDFSPENLVPLPSQADHNREHFAGRRQQPEHVQRRVASRRATLRRQGRTQ